VNETPNVSSFEYSGNDVIETELVISLGANTASAGAYRDFDNIVVSLTEDGIGETPPAKQLVNRTNHMEHSNEFIDTTSWEVVESGTSSMILTDSYGEGPFGAGGIRSTRVQADCSITPATDDTFLRYVFPSGEFATEDDTNYSIYVKGAAGQTFRIRLDSTSTGWSAATNHVTDGTWQRVNIGSDGEANNGILTVTAITCRPLTGTSETLDVEICAAQVTDTSYPVAYINTSLNEKYGLFDGLSWFQTAAGKATTKFDWQGDVFADALPPAGVEAVSSSWLATGDQRSWIIRITDAGAIQFQASDDGVDNSTVKTSTATLPYGSGQRFRMRVEWDAVSQEITFSHALVGGEWQQLGAKVALTIAQIFAGTADLTVGSRESQTADAFSGRVYSAQLYGNSLLADFNPEDNAPGWTANGNAVITSDSTAVTKTVDVDMYVPRDMLSGTARIMGAGLFTLTCPT
jgi:hypothetical protein